MWRELVEFKLSRGDCYFIYPFGSYAFERMGEFVMDFFWKNLVLLTQAQAQAKLNEYQILTEGSYPFVLSAHVAQDLPKALLWLDTQLRRSRSLGIFFR